MHSIFKHVVVCVDASSHSIQWYLATGWLQYRIVSLTQLLCGDCSSDGTICRFFFFIFFLTGLHHFTINAFFIDLYNFRYHMHIVWYMFSLMMAAYVFAGMSSSQIKDICMWICWIVSFGLTCAKASHFRHWVNRPNSVDTAFEIEIHQTSWFNFRHRMTRNRNFLHPLNHYFDVHTKRIKE